MDFVSWSVFGILCLLAEFAVGNFYLFAIGLAFIYPAAADYQGASGVMQFAVLCGGAIVHTLIVMQLRKKRTIRASVACLPDRGQQVEIVEWMDESSARVSYQGRLWEADKLRAEMPDSQVGIIHAIQGSRIIITTTSE